MCALHACIRLCVYVCVCVLFFALFPHEKTPSRQRGRRTTVPAPPRAALSPPTPATCPTPAACTGAAKIHIVPAARYRNTEPTAASPTTQHTNQCYTQRAKRLRTVQVYSNASTSSMLVHVIPYVPCAMYVEDAYISMHVYVCPPCKCVCV